MSICIYVEGGGDSRALKRECRAGFREFLKVAGFAGVMPRIVACGSRESAFDDFKTALGIGRDTVLLLVDSEGPVVAPAANARPWQHLKERDGWDRPNQASDDQCHLMVQVMETWFLADTATLKTYFRPGFKDGALPQNLTIENIPKQDVETGLSRATSRTNKGKYSKGKHSFEILAKLDPAKVKCKSPYAKRLLYTLEQLCQQ